MEPQLMVPEPVMAHESLADVALYIVIALVIVSVIVALTASVADALPKTRELQVLLLSAVTVKPLATKAESALAGTVPSFQVAAEHQFPLAIEVSIVAEDCDIMHKTMMENKVGSPMPNPCILTGS
jgi:hypothetical protein